AEAAAVGRPDAMKGQALVAFVTLKGDRHPSPELRNELIEHVANEIGRFAKPDAIRFAATLPKTRSGKIIRRILKQVAAGNEVRGDLTTLEDMSVLADLRKGED
ncbi:MAG: acetyl-coenzyme A synthetase, partial [Polyangiaceae bacterium]|nr:acetyl-coenzyme A synthetase [Polyangiaceae bacterium]